MKARVVVTILAVASAAAGAQSFLPRISSRQRDCQAEADRCGAEVRRCNLAPRQTADSCCPVFNCLAEECLSEFISQQVLTELRDRCTRACFPADAAVALADGRAKTMAQLVVGDVVVSGTANQTSRVHLFSHRDAAVRARFTRIDHRCGVLLVSPGHYVYVRGRLRSAAAVRVGDELETVSGLSRVTAVDSVVGDGLFNPHTMSGDIVVGGVRASCYTAALPPRLAHIVLSPLRLLYRLGIILPDMLKSGGPDWIVDIAQSAVAASRRGLIAW